MFLLYAIVVGVVGGFVAGGRLANLDTLRLRWAPVAVAGFAVQVVLFSGPVGDAIGALGPLVYVASTAAVLVFVLANVRIAGLAIVATGAALNLLAIVANGGYMPASAAALAAAGKAPTIGFSNSAVVADPVLGPLTDILALPSWLPLANVFSVGDVLIAVGVAVAIAVAMRAPVVRGGSRPGAGGPVRGDTSPD